MDQIVSGVRVSASFPKKSPPDYVLQQQKGGYYLGGFVGRGRFDLFRLHALLAEDTVCLLSAK